MDIQSRILLVIAAAACSLVYILPIWSITLYAPQYKEGLGMLIMVDDVVGRDRHDLQNINILNHYIGMKEIHRDDFAEFDYMPWLFGLLILLALSAALSGKKFMLYLWLGYFILLSAVGMIDFYLWAYDYGHNLDPRAPIKVPGMSYQPPIFGTKQLLNFTAHSYPASGGYALFAAMLTGIYVAFRNRK